ncbi:MAG: Endothelin-converting enzyme 1 [Bryobacterales bacterium]|nr:Endothelin-converting enzyme 1 [Bryobacterales bacterium]
MLRRALVPLAGALFVTLTCQGQTPASSSSSGVDLSAIDKSVNPCQDFYAYACGNWVKNNPVPPQYSVWGRFNQLADHNEEVLRGILEDSEKNQKRSPTDQKVGAFYEACMNESAVEKAGDKPLKPELERILAIDSKDALTKEIASLHNQNINVFFSFGSSPDADNARMTIASADQGGLGLPDKEYYFRKDPKSEETRQKYVEHIARMFTLLGDSASEAGVKARAVMALESSLATAALNRVERRNPHLTHHKMSVTDFEALTPALDFNLYFVDTNSPSFTQMNVGVPDFYKNLSRLLETTGMNDIKSYLTFHYVSSYAPSLSKEFVDANFDFYSRYLTGARELQPRWKRCVQATDRNLGEALGPKYVEKAFAGQSKERTQELVNLIEQEMEADIKSLTWMSDTTKQQALAKLHGVTNKIGYPEKWKDYSSVEISKKDFVGDVREAREYEQHRDLSKIGKPVDRKEFGMTPPTVNAYYSPLQNNINFPAGILQPPFYNNSADMAINFGAIGAVIGHELTHGFDDQGRQFDADGNLRDWWTAQDADEFKKRADCISNEYSGFSPVQGVNLNGKLTLGENGADNAGVRLAFMALTSALQKGLVSNTSLDGYTAQQRFFLGYAQVWCQNVRPEESRHRALTDPHSPGQFRVDGVVQNTPDFASAFGCSAGQPMVSANACRVW